MLCFPHINTNVGDQTTPNWQETNSISTLQHNTTYLTQRPPPSPAAGLHASHTVTLLFLPG